MMSRWVDILLLLYAASSVAQTLTSCPSGETSQASSSGIIYQLCPNTDYQAPSFSIIPGTSDIGTCLNYCASDTRCTWSSYDRVNLICHLKGSASMPNWVVNNNFISFTKQQSPPPQSTQPPASPGTSITTCPTAGTVQTASNGVVYRICPGTDIQEPSFSIMPNVQSSASCLNFCANASGCLRAVYSAQWKTCYLKSPPGGSNTWVISTQFDSIVPIGTSQPPASTTTSSTTTMVSSTSNPPLPTQPSTPGQKPIMGYNSYNDVGCSPNSDWMRQTISAMSTRGLLAAGYQFFQVDCGWQGYNRLSNGSITYDSAAFPDGIKPLSDYARSLGFRWSMYTNQGVYSCDTRYDKLRPGSLGYETQDALMFAAWNTEYVKVDNCFISGSADNAPKAPRTDFPSRFGAMWNALKSVNINRMLICQWGVPYQNSATGTLQGPAAWAPSIATSYRISDDIASGWTNTLRIYNQVLYVVLNGNFGPGKLFDMDLLEVGNGGMTSDEQRTHFAVWATFKSTLMVSTNVPNMTPDTLSILTNSDLISINQDSLATPVKLLQRFSNDFDIFSGPLSNGDQVVMLVDHSNAPSSRTINFADLGISNADAKDVWSGQISKSISTFTQQVAAHGSIVLRLSNIRTMTVVQPQYTYYSAVSATQNGTYKANCPTCSTGSKVGGVGNGNSFTIQGIRTSQITSDVVFDYINCEISYFPTAASNTRTATILVNGGNAVTVLFPITGYDWNNDVLKGWKVRLSGFSTTGPNSIQVLNANGFAPDFDRVGVVA